MPAHSKGMESRTGSGEPFLVEIIGDTDTPPVERPMRSVISMKLSFSVPISVRHLRTGVMTSVPP